jgi:hypothetical protein
MLSFFGKLCGFAYSFRTQRIGKPHRQSRVATTGFSLERGERNRAGEVFAYVFIKCG